MSGGLLALLDDVVALTKLTAATLDDAAAQAVKASAKAAGVVIDDAAVTPRYVTGLAAQRELPIVGRIAARLAEEQAAVPAPRRAAAQRLPAAGDHAAADAGRALSVLRGLREGAPHAGGAEPDGAERQGGGAAGAGRQGAGGREGVRRHPHRLHSVGRDHGHRARRHHGARSSDAGARPRRRRGFHHRRRLRRRGADREGRRHRRQAGAAGRHHLRSRWAARWCTACRRSSRR